MERRETTHLEFSEFAIPAAKPRPPLKFALPHLSWASRSHNWHLAVEGTTPDDYTPLIRKESSNLGGGESGQFRTTTPNGVCCKQKPGGHEYWVHVAKGSATMVIVDAPAQLWGRLREFIEAQGWSRDYGITGDGPNFQEAFAPRVPRSM